MKRSYLPLFAPILLLLGFDHGALATPRLEGARAPRIVRSVSVPGDELWWDGFGLPVTDGTVSAAIEYKGSLVIAGRFTRIGNVRVNNIARWDGVTWLSLGKGIEWGNVSSLAIHQGDLVAAGDYSFAGGVLARSIARWNGTEWSGFGQGFHDPNTNPREVRCIASQSDTLVAAVDLSYEHYYGDPSPVPYPYLVGYWTGSDWVDVGPGANGPIWSLAFYGGALFAGGAFDSIGGVPAAGIARWDGTAWSEVGGGIGASGRSVNALFVHSGRLIAGGGFESAGGAAVSNIAAWDGYQWEPLGSLPMEVSALTAKENVLLAGGEDAITRWDGESWSSAAPALEGRPAALVPQGAELFVVGAIEGTNPGEDVPTALSVALLSNGTWQSLMNVGDRMQGLTSVGGQQAWVGSMVSYRGHIVAAGSFRYGGAPPSWTKVPRLAEWTGTQWVPFPSPPGLDLVYILVANGDTLYAAGTLQGSEGSPSSIYRYDGVQWTPLGNQIFFVNAMTLFNGDLYAAVDHYSSGINEASIRRWTGATWETVGRAGGPLFPRIHALTESDGRLVVAGRFTSMEGASAANIAAWDGSAWQQFGPGLPPPPYLPQAIVRNLALSDGDLVVAGDHIQGVVRWSGLAWEPLGELVGLVGELETAGGYLFASGYFQTTDYSSSSYSLARWHENRWERLGSGTNQTVHAFAALGSSVYMGGSFSDAGGKASYAIARWDGLPAAPAAPTLQAPRPNPFGTSTTFSYSLPTSGSVRLSIHDVRGREIAVIEAGQRSTGTHAATWYGRDHSGRKVASGVYFLKAALPGGVHQSRKVVLLH